MRRTLVVAAMAAATLIAGGGTAAASESPSPSSESGSAPSADSPESATPLERVSAYTQPSIVYIETEWTGYVWDTYNNMYLNNGNPFTMTGSCTGFVVNPDGYIATAGHCVDPDEVKFDFQATAAEWALTNAYYEATDLTMEDVLGFGHYVIKNAEDKKKPDLKVTAAWAVSAGGVETGKALPARVLKWSPLEQGDGAIIKVEADNLNALPLAAEDPDVGTEIVTVGYPGSVRNVSDASLTPSYKEGSVSSLTTIENGLTSVYEISAPTSRGMSGGPAVNLDGEVVGVISFAPADEAQPFNFIQPIDITREMLSDAGPENALSEDGEAYRAGLDAYFAGDKETAVENLSLVVEDQPTNDIAKQYLDKAEELPEPASSEPSSSDEGGSSMGLIIGIVVGVLVLLAVVGAVLMAMSKKKKGSSASGGHAYSGPMAAPGPGYQQQGGTSPAPSGVSTAVLTPPAPTQAQLAAPPQPAASATPPAPVAEQETDQTVFCQNCGSKGEAGQKFCKHCGTAL